MIARLRGGLSMAYEEAGSGTPLLLVHGWPHDHTLWAGQLAGLATSARCLAPDLRGFGGSTIGGPYSIDQYADDLAAFLASLGVAQAVVCGLSMGGYVAFSLWRRHRALVRALVLADTRASSDGPEARDGRMRLAALIEAEGMEELAARQLERMVGRSTLDHQPQIAERVRRMMAAAPAEGAMEAQRAMAERVDSTDLLATIDVPTLVIGGAEDVLTPPEELRTLAASIPGSRLALLESCGHVSPLERPAAFNHIVHEFLQSLLHA